MNATNQITRPVNRAKPRSSKLFGVMLDSKVSSNSAVPSIELVWGVKIRLRDGVDLNATVYKPKTDERLPVIFTLTPYTADNYHDRAFYFAQNGYVFVLVDCRGRGNSEGKFVSNYKDGLDGYDVVEWLAVQPWSNGKVGMWGGSYAGFNQWATLKESPPHLATIVPAAAFCPEPGVEFNGIFPSYEIRWWTLVSGTTANQKLFSEEKFWIGKFQQYYIDHVPFQNLDKVVGNPSEHFQWIVKSPEGDPNWETVVPKREDYKRIGIPILTITGHYDGVAGDQLGALHYYKMHMQHGTTLSVSRHYLLVGPWDHPGTRTPSKEFGGIKFGDASLIDMNKLHREWYDWTLKDGKKPNFLKKRVTYYVSGAEEWKYSDNFQRLGVRKWRLYLDSDGEANDVFHSGRLSETKPRNSPADKYTYDPLDLRPGELETEEIKDYIVDQRYALGRFGNGVVYHSSPLQRETEITGYTKLLVWVSMDVPDTDFGATVYEILPNGTSVLLTREFMRARYRNSSQKPELVRPGEVNAYEFKRFCFFSRKLQKFSRIRLLVESPNTIYLEKNYNGGGVVEKESSKDSRTAHISLYHDREHPSLLELPVNN